MVMAKVIRSNRTKHFEMFMVVVFLVTPIRVQWYWKLMGRVALWLWGIPTS